MRHGEHRDSKQCMHASLHCTVSSPTIQLQISLAECFRLTTDSCLIAIFQIQVVSKEAFGHCWSDILNDWHQNTSMSRKLHPCFANPVYINDLNYNIISIDNFYKIGKPLANSKHSGGFGLLFLAVKIQHNRQITHSLTGRMLHEAGWLAVT